MRILEASFWLVGRRWRMLPDFGPVNCDGSLQLPSDFSHVASLSEGSRRNVGPDFVPEHFLSVFRELHIDRELFSVPLQSAVEIGVNVACCGS